AVQLPGARERIVAGAACRAGGEARGHGCRLVEERDCVELLPAGVHRVVAGPAVEEVVPVPTGQLVVAAVPAEEVVAAVADETVVAAASEHTVVGRVSRARVGAVAAVQLLDVRERVLAVAGRGACDEARGHGPRLVEERGGVELLSAPVHRVVAGAAVDEVVP